MARRFDRMCRTGHGPLPHRSLEGHPLGRRGGRRRANRAPPAVAEVPGPHRLSRHERQCHRGGGVSRRLGPGRVGGAPRQRRGGGGGRRERLPDPPHAAIPAQAELASSPTRIASVSPSAYNRGGPMKARELLAACFFLFGALLIWPLLTIANRPVLVGGVPALVVYLFAVWAIIVSVLIVVAIRRRAPEDDE